MGVLPPLKREMRKKDKHGSVPKKGQTQKCTEKITKTEVHWKWDKHESASKTGRMEKCTEYMTILHVKNRTKENCTENRHR